MRSTKRDREAIQAYVEQQAREAVIHVEKAASELVGPVRRNIWDAQCAEAEEAGRGPGHLGHGWWR